MEDNYTEEQIKKIVNVASYYGKDVERIRTMLDEYWDGQFETALDSVSESLQTSKEDHEYDAYLDEMSSDGYDD